MEGVVVVLFCCSSFGRLSFAHLVKRSTWHLCVSYHQGSATLAVLLTKGNAILRQLRIDHPADESLKAVNLDVSYIERFLRRFQIEHRTFHGQNASLRPETYASRLKAIQDRLLHYQLDRIFNADEVFSDFLLPIDLPPCVSNG